MITIVGTGAMASLFASRLAPVAPVQILGTWGEAITAMNAAGVVLENESGRRAAKVRATADPRDCAGSQFAVVLVKAWQTARAAEQIKSALAPSGLALTLQNGIGNYEALASALGADRAALGITTQGATLIAPGRVREGGRGPIYLADHPRAAELIEAFRAAGFEVHTTPDVTSLAWGKLAINAAINALTAILRVPNGELLRRPEALALMDSAARETAQVAAAKGIALPFADPAARAREVAQATAANRSSMLQDVLRGAPTEIEAINGAVAREGARLGAPTPTNEILWRLVRAMVNG